MGEEITLNITRYNPDKDGKYTTQRYSIPYKNDWSILDALNYVKAELDGSLTYRWSCRMAVCGRCGMMVNGTPRLTCSTYLNEFYPKEITIEPLANFPVIRDLVVDINDFMAKLKSAKPWIIRKNKRDEGKADRREVLASEHGVWKCTVVGDCTEVCPKHVDPSAAIQRTKVDSAINWFFSFL